jgi:hypothetical protein
VVDLRETFDRRGTVRQEGSFRQWTNGALQVLLEPTPTGQRVRMSTVKVTARAWLTGGMLSAGIAAIVAVAAVVGGSHNNATRDCTKFTAAGPGLKRRTEGRAKLPEPSVTTVCETIER